MQRHVRTAFSALLRLYVSILGLMLGTIAAATGCSGGRDHAVSLETVRSSRSGPSDEPPLIGVSGDQIRTPRSDASLKAIALVFVLADCPICNAYIPELNRLHESFTPRGVRLVVIQADPDITAERASAHATEYGVQPLVARDPRHEWVKRAGATTAPEAAVFSPAGELLYRGRINDQYAGLGKRRANVTSHDLREALEAIIAGQPVRETQTEAIGCPIPELPLGE